MRVDGNLIRACRERRAWSQEHLSKVAGIGLRTVQRIEASGLASYASVQAIAAVLEITAEDLYVAKPAPPIASASASETPARRTRGMKRTHRVRRPFVLSAAGIAASLLAGVSIFFTQDIAAEQVSLDVDMTVAAQGELQTQRRRTTLTAKVEGGGVLAVFDDAHRVLVTISPAVHSDGTVLLAMKVFEVAAGTDFLKYDVEHSVPVSTPAILVADSESGEVTLDGGERQISIKITPSVLH